MKEIVYILFYIEFFFNFSVLTDNLAMKKLGPVYCKQEQRYSIVHFMFNIKVFRPFLSIFVNFELFSDLRNLVALNCLCFSDIRS